MSVHRYDTADGPRWQVRWRETHGRVRTRSLTSKSAALAFDADVKARKYKGDALPQPARETLAAAYTEWWRLRGTQLAASTQRTYTAMWTAHIEGRFDHHYISELASQPQLIEELIADMRERGVGPAAQRKVLVVVSAVLTACVEWRKISSNPVWQARKPPAARQRIPHPFPPIVIENIRRQISRRATKGRIEARASADACFVGLLAYAGLRPGEALALTWGDVGTRTLAIDKAAADGEEGPTKTGGARTVPLVEIMRHELESLRHARSNPSDSALVFPSANGSLWSRSEFNNWRNRVWKPVLRDMSAASGLDRLAAARPYDCRGSFVSLQLRAGASPLEVAAWAGHSPAVMFKHYANVIEELVGEPVLPANDQIERARVVMMANDASQMAAMIADVLERPTIESADDEGAAHLLYAPYPDDVTQLRPALRRGSSSSTTHNLQY